MALEILDSIDAIALGRYADRSACTTSTRAARAAGTSDATRAAPARTAVATTMGRDGEEERKSGEPGVRRAGHGYCLAFVPSKSAVRAPDRIIDML